MANYDRLPDTALVSAQVCAEICGIHISTWHSNVQGGSFPPPVMMLGPFRRWNIGQIRAMCRGEYVKLEDGTWEYANKRKEQAA